MFFGSAARAYDAHRARFEGRALVEDTIRAAVSLVRTVSLMVEQGEASAEWALWARAWCFFVGLLVAPGLSGLGPVALVAFLRATYDRAEPYASRREAFDGARLLMWTAAGAPGQLPPQFRDPARRVVDAWAELVERGLSSGGCAWCGTDGERRRRDGADAAAAAPAAPSGAVVEPGGPERWEAETWCAWDGGGVKHRVLLEVWYGTAGDERVRVFRSPGEVDRARWDNDVRRLVSALLGRPLASADVLVSIGLETNHGPVVPGAGGAGG